MFAMSYRSRLLLERLSQGASQQELLAAHQGGNGSQLARAARQALLLERAMARRRGKVRKILRQYPRTFDRWTPFEETQLRDLYRAGKTLREIAAHLQRQPNAVKVRLSRIDL